MIPDSVGRRKNLPAPKGCKDNKLYAEIRYQITPHATREIYKQAERIKIASEKQEPLTNYLSAPIRFKKLCNFLVQTILNHLISQKKIDSHLRTVTISLAFFCSLPPPFWGFSSE